MVDRVPPPPNNPPPHGGDSGEDFLFHLYRGSELLQDNRVSEAKTELEQALALDPSDPKAQDLLGVVYFRLGLYPRAIGVYEKLVNEHEGAHEPRINLGLCYLKTGQPIRARQELEKVVAQFPTHTRAWGYLGLAHQSLGDIDRAIHAFTRGGHDAMVRRLMDATAGQPPPSQARPVLPPGTFLELDRSADLAPSSALPQSLSAGWDALLAAANATSATNPGPAKPIEAPRISEAAKTVQATAAAPVFPTEPAIRPALKAGELGRQHTLVFPRSVRVATHVASGVVLVQAAGGFAVRMSLVRLMAFSAGNKVMPKRSRGRAVDGEQLGGETNPLVELEGHGELVLAPPADHQLVPITLEDEPVYLREDTLAGFEASMSYENGRMPGGDDKVVGMVQLRGPGSLIALITTPMYAIEVEEGKSATVHAPSVIGWMGRIIPRSLPPTEAPGGARELVVFSGEGTVLLHGR